MGVLRIARAIRDLACSMDEPLSVEDLAEMLDAPPQRVKLIVQLARILKDLDVDGETIRPVRADVDSPASRVDSTGRATRVVDSRDRRAGTQPAAGAVSLETLSKPFVDAETVGPTLLREGDFHVLGTFYQLLQARPKHLRGEPIRLPLRFEERTPTEQGLMEAALRHSDWIELRAPPATSGGVMWAIFTERGHHVGRVIASFEKLGQVPLEFEVERFGLVVRVVPEEPK
ncbi:MAG: hypothetical protein Kow0069_34040 [Promethearchaeota archaeon]